MTDWFEMAKDICTPRKVERGHCASSLCEEEDEYGCMCMCEPCILQKDYEAGHTEQQWREAMREE